MDSHLERNGLGFRGFPGRAHDLAANSWAIHLSKMALDVGSRPSHLRNRSRGATEKAASVFTCSMTLKLRSTERFIEPGAHRRLRGSDSALSR